MEIRLYVLEDYVEVPIVSGLYDSLKLDYIVMFLELFQEDHFPESPLCISCIVECIKDLYIYI